MSGRHAVVTGAGGFVGRHLVGGFAAAGWRVTGLDRAFDAAAGSVVGASARPSSTVSLITSDLAHGVPPAIEAADLVVHAAAVTTDPQALGWTALAHLEANIRPLFSVLGYVERTRPAAFVFLSSSGVFAPTDGVEWLRDTDEPTGRSPYALAKRAGEVMSAAARAAGAAVHVVRLGHLYGPHEVPRATRERVSLVAQWLTDARAGRPLAVRADDPSRDWTCVSDLAAAMLALVEGGAGDRPVHLGCPFVLRDRAMAALVAAQVPGATIDVRPCEGAVKPPMRPSAVPVLAGFPWTTPADGIARLARGEVAA